MKLSNKVAIVTGAGSGIGREIAREFARSGAKVVVSDYVHDSGMETVELIKKEGGEAIFLMADVSNELDVDRLITQTVKKFGRIDILVNNAGILDELKSVIDLTVEEWDRVIAVNLRGPFLGAKKVIPEMKKNDKGVIINIASIASFGGGRGGAAYTASKHAVLGLTRQLSLDHGIQGIRVNAICPGPVESAITAPIMQMPDHPLVQAIKATPAGRIGKPEEVAKLALFLASEDSEYIHGTAIVIDGGYTVK